jgi:hypothetical protein
MSWNFKSLHLSDENIRDNSSKAPPRIDFKISNVRAHNPKAAGSNPAPATKKIRRSDRKIRAFLFWGSSRFSVAVVFVSCFF